MDLKIITTQVELDVVRFDYDGIIIINSSPEEPITIAHEYNYLIEAHGNSLVILYNNCKVKAYDNSHILAFDRSEVLACGNNIIKAFNNSHVCAGRLSTVYSWDTSKIDAYGSNVIAYEYSYVQAHTNSGKIAAYDNSNIVSWGDSCIEAYGNSQIVDISCHNKNIIIHANARIVNNPANIKEWANSHGIPITDGKIRLYKAVHKIRGMYFADYNTDFEYTIGETAVADWFSTDNMKQCGHGIHLATKEKAVEYGKKWADMAILELEANANEVVVPLYDGWKVRAPKAKVLREVPMSEIF